MCITRLLPTGECIIWEVELCIGGQGKLLGMLDFIDITCENINLEARLKVLSYVSGLN